MKDEKVNIEKYKDVDLMYSKQDGRIYFQFEGNERKVQYVFEAREIIDEPIWEPCELDGYFVDGTFHDHIGKAKATRKNVKSGKPEWKYAGKYNTVFKLPNYGQGEKVYARSKDNDAVYAAFKEQQSVVNDEERKLKQIISKLT